MGRGQLAGAAHLELVSGVVHLRPQDAMFEAMLRGWRAQQVARGLQESTIEPRERLVRRLAEFCNEYPWAWGPGHVEEWTLSLTSEHHLAPSTVRGYQTELRLFTEFLIDGRYGWAAACQEAFGPDAYPVAVCHEWNTIAHLNEYEGSPEARPLSREELQRFFDYADEQVERAVKAKRKGRWRLTGTPLCSRSSTAGGCAGLRRRSWIWLTGAAIRPRRSSAGTGCCTSATARRCAVSRPGAETWPR